MSDKASQEQPWFVELLETGTSVVPGTTATVQASQAERGAVDVPSGRLRIDIFQFWTEGSPLDEVLEPGEWMVSAVEDQHPSASIGDLLLRLRRTGSQPAVKYRRATQDGRPARASGQGLLIGDEDIAGVLTDSLVGEGSPWWLGGPVKTRDPVVEEGDLAGRLVEGAPLRAYYLGRRGWNPEARRPEKTHRPGRADIWAGVSADGRVCEIVLDFTAIVRAEPFEVVPDPWAVPVVGGPGLLLESPESAPESAPVQRLIDEAPSGHLMFLGHVALQGQLAAYDPGCPDWGAELPVVVPTGRYPAFAVAVDRADVILLRLGDRRPERWLRVGGVGVETGQYVISSMELRDRIKQVGRGEMQQVALDLSFDVASMPTAPKHGFVINAYTYGDVGVDVFVGVDSDGAAVAVVVPLLVEWVFAHRPAAEDVAAAETAQRLRAEAPDGSEPARLFDEDWPDLEMALRSGEMTRDQRSSLHYLVDVMKDHLTLEG